MRLQPSMQVFILSDHEALRESMRTWYCKKDGLAFLEKRDNEKKRNLKVPFSKSTRYWNKSCTKLVCENFPLEQCEVMCNGVKVFLDAHLNMHQQFDNIFLSVGIQTRTLWKFKREFKASVWNATFKVFWLHCVVRNFHDLYSVR